MKGRLALLVAVAVVSAAVTFGVAFVRSTRTPNPAELRLESLPEGVSEHRFAGRLVFLVRTGNSVIGLLGRSTHLGERVTWCPEDQVFLSFAHGEAFDRAGKVVVFPAPRDLDRVRVTVTGARVIVDSHSVTLGAPAHLGLSEYGERARLIERCKT